MFTSNMHQYLHAQLHLQQQSLICKSKRFLSAQRLFKHLLYFCNWQYVQWNIIEDCCCFSVAFVLALTVFQVLGYSQIVGRLYYSRGLISPLALFLPDVYKALIYVFETWSDRYRDSFIKLKFNTTNMDYCIG